MSIRNMAMTKHKQSGLTLVELMISLALSLIIIAGVFQIFLSSKQTYRVQEALARVQENGRFALDLLTRDIRMAGNVGCNRFADITNTIPELPNIDSGITGYDDNQADPVFNMYNDGGSPTVEVGDAIFIRGASSLSSELSAGMTNTTDDISITNDIGIAANDIVVISDCDNTDIFVAGSSGTTISHGTALSKEYGTDAQVMPLAYTAYYINARDGADDDDPPSLYRKTVSASGGANDAEELVEGVVDMQILYGEEIAENTITYTSAQNVSDMDDVSTVRINLLFATLDDNLVNEPQSYWFNDNDVAIEAGDRRLYRTMSTTITLRN